MPDSFQYDVFLSHNQADKPRVRWLAERLRAAGLRVWFDEWVIQPSGSPRPSDGRGVRGEGLAIERGLEASRTLVLCLSPAALGSDWVGLERSTVGRGNLPFRAPANAGRRFIRLLLADCKLPDTLRRSKHLDFRDETKTAFSEVLVACQTEIGVMKRRLGLPRRARRVSLRRGANQSNATPAAALSTATDVVDLRISKL